jgi:hypothetical protein
MGVKAETAKRLRSSVFLVVVGLGCGSLMGFAITPHAPADAAGAGGSDAGAAASHSHSFMSNLHMPSFTHHEDHHEEEEEHPDHGVEAGDHDDHKHEDAHAADDSGPAIAALPEVTHTAITAQTHKQSGKQSWANPEHRWGGCCVYKLNRF